MKHVFLGFLLFTITIVVVACGPAEFTAVGEDEQQSVKMGDPTATTATVPGPPLSCLNNPAIANQLAAQHSCGGKKTYICHVPQGNPPNRHTLCLPPTAIRAHLREHDASSAPGDEDHLGQCGPTLPPPPTVGVDPCVPAPPPGPAPAPAPGPAPALGPNPGGNPQGE